MFVRWECGCVGIRITEPDRMDIVLQFCDNDQCDGIRYGMRRRGLKKKKYEVLSGKGMQVGVLMQKINKLILDGEAFGEVKRLLG